MPQIKSVLVPLFILVVVSICFGNTDSDSRNVPIPIFIPLHYDIEVDLSSLVDEQGKLFATVPVKLKISGKMNGFSTETPSAFSYEDIIRFCSLKVTNESSRPMQFADFNDGFLNSAQISYIKVENDTHYFMVEEDIESRNNFSTIGLKRDITSEVEMEGSMVYNMSMSELLTHETWTSTEEDGEREYFLTKYSRLHRSKKQFFPCGMDPNVLSTFQLTVIRNENHTAVTNAKLLSSEPIPERSGIVQDKFEETPPIKVASFSFFLTNFESLSRTSADGTIVNFHAPQCILDEFDRGNFIVDAAVNILDIYSGYFNDRSVNSTSASAKHLPIGKIDVFLDRGQVPLLEPGLVAFNKPKIFLTEQEFLGYGTRRWLAPLWTRKMTEQDLTIDLIRAITLEWFNPYDNLLHRKHSLTSYDIKVNFDFEYSLPPHDDEEEALKLLHVYFMDEALSSVNSKFLWNGTLKKKLACESDYGMTGRRDAHRVMPFCGGEIWKPENFLVLRMLSDDYVLGRESIRNAISSFREKMEYENQVGWNIINGRKYKERFIESLQEAAQEGQSYLPENVSVKDVVNSWEKQMIRPKEDWDELEIKQLIIVKVDIVNDTHLSFTQERIKGPSADSDWNSFAWHLPVSVQTEEGLQAKFWLSNNSIPVIVPVNHTDAKWVLLDPNSTSIHRTLYDPILLRKIQRQLELDPTVFSPLARYKLFSDYFRFITPSSLTKVADLNGTHLFENVTVFDALEFTRYLNKEDDIVVWSKALGIFAFTLPGSPQYDGRPNFPMVEHLNEYLRPKFSAVLHSIDIPSITLHSSDKMKLEAWILFNACVNKNPACKGKVSQLFNQWKADPEYLSFKNFDSEVALLVMAIFSGGGKEGFDFAAERYFAGRNVIRTVRSPLDANALISMVIRAQDKESIEVLLVNLTEEVVTDDNPFGLRWLDNRRLSAYLDNIPEEARRSFVGVELYRKFFYKHCDRLESMVSSLIAKGDEANADTGASGSIYYYRHEIDITNLFPDTFTTAQFHDLMDFVDSDPKCIRSTRKGTVAIKLLKLYSQVRKHEEWMNSSGNKIYSWFENNKQSE